MKRSCHRSDPRVWMERFARIHFSARGVCTAAKPHFARPNDTCHDHEKITGFAGLSPIRADGAYRAGRSGQWSRTERAFPDSAGRIGRFPSGLNPPSTHVECGFKSRPGHSHAGVSCGSITGPESLRVETVRRRSGSFAMSWWLGDQCSSATVAGVHPKVVSERLGHSSIAIAITLDLYSHVTPGISRDAFVGSGA